MENELTRQPKRPKGSNDRIMSSAIDYVQNELNQWVEDALKHWKPPSKLENERVILEPLHGVVKLEPYEIAIVNLPIVQRLRDMRQAGLARYIYPGMQHSRFEHSLGVLSVAESMLNSLSQEQKIDPLARCYIRIAAILHDVGKLPFSYLSETIIEEQLPELVSQIREERLRGKPQFFAGNSLAEIFSYLIVTCPAFKKALDTYIIPVTNAQGCELLSKIDLDRVGRLIIGKKIDGEDSWLRDIINGPFDADLIDYLTRDSYYSGIKLNVDISRIVQGLRIARGSRWDGSLALSADSVIYLESFLLAKLKMYFEVYSHYKLRALECMFRGAFEQPQVSGIHIPSSIREWFGTTEHELFPDASKLIGRGLIKRCLVLDRTTVEQDSLGPLERLALEIQDSRILCQLRQTIYKNLPTHARTTLAELWVDSPMLPTIYRGGLIFPVLLSPDRVESLVDLFPINLLMQSYIASKINVSVFYSDDPAGRQLVADIAGRIFKKKYGIRLKPLAQALALQDLSEGT